MTREQRIEYNAQARAKGYVITKPSRPIIASRPFDPSAIHSAEGALNAKRMAVFHARWRGQAEPNLQLWSA